VSTSLVGNLRATVLLGIATVLRGQRFYSSLLALAIG